MCVFAGCWNTDGAWPVPVDVAHLERQSLEVVRCEICSVVNGHIVRRHRTAASNAMSHQVEIHPVPVGDGVVQDGARRSDSKAASRARVERRVDSFLHHDECKLGLIVGEGVETLQELWDLVQFDGF